MAKKDSVYQSTKFDSRIIEELPDGWRCEVEIPEAAKQDNTLYLQFTYNNDDDVSVQIEQPVMLP